MRIEELKKFQGLNPAVDFLLGKLEGQNRETALVEMVFHLGTQLQMLQAAKAIKPEPAALVKNDSVVLDDKPLASMSSERDEKAQDASAKPMDIEPRILPIEGKSDRMRKLDKDWEPERDTAKKKRGWRW